MNDQDDTTPHHRPGSGSRWEPDQTAAEEGLEQPGAAQGEQPPDDAAATTVAESPARPWVKQMAAGVGVLLLGGLGGYAIGHAAGAADQTAPTSVPPGQQGQQGAGPGSGGEGLPGGGQQGPGGGGLGRGPGGFGGPDDGSGSDGQMTPPQGGTGRGGNGDGSGDSTT